MPRQDQLEIIGPSGQVEFYLLDPAQGVTNIGRHPDNDVVLDSPSVDLFQAVLDHQQKPYRIMILSEEAEARLGGQLLVPNIFQELHDWDTVEMDGYAIILLEGTEGAVPEEPTTQPAPLPAIPPARQAAAAPVGFIPVPARPPDEVDEIIVAELSEREWTLDVEQTESFELNVTNGGSIVATFEIGVEGVDGRWVTISPDSINLNEGARGTVAVSITPPRRPTSSAGPHHLAVMVTSPNYPDRVSRLGASLTINPYYEFAIGELSPKQQTVSWRKQSGQVSLPVANRGNSGATFRLEGDDDERACRFEFEVPGEEVRLARQVEMRLSPDETRILPLSITPIRRRFIGLRARAYSYTITTALVEAAQTPRSVMGQIKSRPLIGPLLLLLIAVAFVAVLVFLTRPVRVPLLIIEPFAQGESGSERAPHAGLPAVVAARPAQDLEVAWPGGGAAQVWPVQGNSATTMPDEAVTLRYNGARFQAMSPWNILNRLNALFLELRLEFRSGDEEWRTVKTPPEFEDIAGTFEVVAPSNGQYRLRADTWISNLVPVLSGTSKEISVFVTPVQPRVVYFRATPDRPLIGSEVTISWRVEGAERLTLSYEGIEETLQDEELVSGSRTQVLNRDTTFTLIASNRFNPEGVKEPLTIALWVPTATPTPTPTPIPTPVIERFDVNPVEITAGETVRLSWQVTGADTVTINPLGGEFLLQGDIGDQPTTLTTYRLTARKIAPDGTEAKNSASSQVFVKPPPTPTPVPQAPEVQVFDAVPKEIVEGDNTEVTLTWSVAGKTTDIQITGGGVPLTGLKPQGSISINISEEVIFVLTAYNGQLSSSKHVQIGTVEATPVPPEAPVIADFSAEVEGGKLVSYNPGTEVYKILEDANVTLKWAVSGEEVEIELNGKRVSGEEKDMGPIRADVDYQLLAKNEGGDDIRDLYIRVAARELPPPTDFTYEPSTRTFSWSYPRPDDIEGFRLYAVREGESNRVPVAGEDELTADVYAWTLPDDRCGVFYLVAVYEDPYNGDAPTETDAAEASWGVPCP